MVILQPVILNRTLAAVEFLLLKFGRRFACAIFVSIAFSHESSFLMSAVFQSLYFFVVLFVFNFFALNIEQFNE